MSRAISILLLLAILTAGASLLRLAPAPLAEPPDSDSPHLALDQADHIDPNLISHVPQSPAFSGVVPAADYRRAVIFGHAGKVHRDRASDRASGDRLAQAGPGALVLLPLALVRVSEFEQAVPVDPEPGEPEPRALTYWRDAMPIIRAECTSCHYTGGIGPFPLETYADARQSSFLIRRAMEERFMPPLPADPKTSWPIDDPRVMSDADRETLVAWVAAGAPEGDPADAPEIPPPVDYGPPTRTFDIGVDYTPPEGVMDDYRCFVIDPGFSQDAELVMVDVEQTNRQMFHHGILYLADPRVAADARRLDAADPGPGYPCFGGPGFSSDEWVAGEAVGALPRPYPAGTAKVIPAGSIFALQLHYNTNNGRGMDRTKVHLWQAASPVGKPPRDARMANFLFSIPPGDTGYSVKASIDVVSARDTGRPGLLRGRVAEGLLWRSWGHMHVLGSSYTLDLIRADGSRVRVLDIPHWDFNWQGTYDHIDPLEIEAGDRLEMTCTWDNSPANQPYIDGKQVQPRTVHWGESTFDEMCLGGVTVTDG